MLLRGENNIYAPAYQPTPHWCTISLMQYSAAHRKVIYTLDDTSRIQALIPSASLLSPGNIAVPLTLPNMQLLTRVGLPAMSPIEVDYDWPSRFPNPRPNQVVTAAFKTLNPRNLDTSEQRTGKTLSSLWASDFLMLQGMINRGLIISTLSTLERVWDKEIKESFYGRRSSTILHGTIEKRLERLAQPQDFYIINHDGVGVGLKREKKRFILGELADTIIRRHDINLILIDEISAYKHASSDRYRVIERIVNARPDMWVWGLTGTPAATSPLDAWAIARLVWGPVVKPTSFKTFRNQTMSQKSEFVWIPRKEARDIVAKWLQPSIRFTRKDLGFPPLSYRTVMVKMSKQQEEAYKTMRKKLKMTLESGKVIDAVNEATVRMKLIQIACGAVYDQDHAIHLLDAQPRLEALLEIIDNADKKVIVFAPLTSAINLIYSYVSKKYSCVRVVGGVSTTQRNEILRSFQDDRDPVVLIADPRPLAHGLELTSADTIVWFGPTENLEHYEQANARIDGPAVRGEVIHLAGTVIEREIYRRQTEKQSLQGAILTLLEAV